MLVLLVLWSEAKDLAPAPRADVAIPVCRCRFALMFELVARFLVDWVFKPVAIFWVEVDCWPIV